LGDRCRLDVTIESNGYEMTEDEQGFQAPQTITPEGLADDLTVLVWESFTDFISEWESSPTLAEAGLIDEEGEPDRRAVEEALIFLMWAHTRGAQQAFVGRAPAELIKTSLDGLHDAILEDMVDNGTPRDQLPYFEKRVSVRYGQYHTAAAVSDTALGEAVVHHMTGSATPAEALVEAVTERAVEVSGPLRDYLEDVELVP
jgi:hypothetical protein